MNAQDRTIVRDLARQVMDLAESDVYETRRKRWRDVNALRKPDRAPVWCRPAAAWAEILPEGALLCEDPFCRGVERKLRMDLFKHEVGDDHVVAPWWDAGAAFDCDAEHVWGLKTKHLTGSTELGGFHYDPPVKSVEDYEKVHVPKFSYNAERTETGAARMVDLLGDVMPVRIAGRPPLAALQAVYLENLRGMAAMLEDMAFQPHVVHRIMAKLTEGILNACRAAEESGRLAMNNHEPMTCSDPVGEAADGQVGLHNLWTAVNSQEFQNVSPAMWDEFLLSYQRPVLQQFGLVQYGCCEDLTHKIRGVLTIPNLRIFVSSYWTDLGKVVEAVGQDYTIMWRQLSADVTVSTDLERVRRHLREGMRKMKGCYYQIVMREIQTLGPNPRSLHDWARTAIEAAEEEAW